MKFINSIHKKITAIGIGALALAGLAVSPASAVTNVTIHNSGTSGIGTCAVVPTYDSDPTTSDCPSGSYALLPVGSNSTASTIQAVYVGTNYRMRLQRNSDGYFYSWYNGPKWLSVGQGTTATYNVFSEKISSSGTGVPASAPSGYTRVFTEEFPTAVAQGSWRDVYGTKFTDYTDGPTTSEQGNWNTAAIASATGGEARYNWKSINGVPQGAAISPNTSSFAYGRYSVRFKVDSNLDGFANAWLLWPDSENWNQGEVDFPEGSLTSTIQAFNHELGNPGNNAYGVDTGVPFAGAWHTATTDWSAGSLKFYLDGTLVGSTTNNVPTAPMHYVLQTEDDYGNVNTATTGVVHIDWVTVDKKN